MSHPEIHGIDAVIEAHSAVLRSRLDESRRQLEATEARLERLERQSQAAQSEAELARQAAREAVDCDRASLVAELRHELALLANPEYLRRNQEAVEQLKRVADHWRKHRLSAADIDVQEHLDEAAAASEALDGVAQVCTCRTEKNFWHEAVPTARDCPLHSTGPQPVLEDEAAFARKVTEGDSRRS
jgi:hypothetical protein